MDRNSSVSDPRFAYQFCWALAQLFSGPNINAVVNAMNQVFSERFTPQEYPLHQLLPPMVILKGQSMCIVLVQGIRTAEQVSLLVASYIEGREQRTNNGFVVVADLAVPVFRGRLQAFDCLDFDRIILAGHSYGGMLMMSLANSLATERLSRMVSLATFGSPKGGDDRMAWGMQRIDYKRYMNVGDDITFCPPTSDQAPLTHLILPRWASISINELVLVGEGKVITDTGTITDAGYPPLPGIFTDLSIANFLVRNEAPTALAHNINEYERRMRAWSIANPEPPVRQRAAGNEIGQREPVQEAPVPPIPVWQPGMPANEMAGGNLPIAQIPGREQLEQAGFNVPNPVAALIPSSPPAVGGQAQKPYKTRKVGRMWIAYYIEADRVCIIGKSKTQAKLFARRMNLALGTWDQAAATDEAGFEQSAIDAFN